MHAEPNMPAVPLGPQGSSPTAPLVAHVIYRLDMGGLENGLVNLVNRIPHEHFRHAIICLTGYSDFRSRIRRSDIPVYSLNKPPGNSPATYFKLWRLLRELRPDIVHTRNLAALEGMAAAALAGVPARVHGEHGRDVGDLDGSNRKYRIWRRLFKPCVHQYIAVSRDLASYLELGIGVPRGRIAQIYNGVDTEVFHPAQGQREQVAGAGFAGADHFVIGTVGRMQHVKDQLTLARAFVRLMHTMPFAERKLRLVMIGDGPLRARAWELLVEAGVAQYAWLPGRCDDVPRIMRALDLFVLPSLAEGISNTILEAMASGLPVVATGVGGNADLVENGVTGTIVPPADPDRMAAAIRCCAEDIGLSKRLGAEGRRVAIVKFSVDTMVDEYVSLYNRLLANRTKTSVSERR